MNKDRQHSVTWNTTTRNSINYEHNFPLDMFMCPSAIWIEMPHGRPCSFQLCYIYDFYLSRSYSSLTALHVVVTAF